MPYNLRFHSVREAYMDVYVSPPLKDATVASSSKLPDATVEVANEVVLIPHTGAVQYPMDKQVNGTHTRGKRRGPSKKW